MLSAVRKSSLMLPLKTTHLPAKTTDKKSLKAKANSKRKTPSEKCYLVSLPRQLKQTDLNLNFNILTSRFTSNVISEIHICNI